MAHSGRNECESIPGSPDPEGNPAARQERYSDLPDPQPAHLVDGTGRYSPGPAGTGIVPPGQASDLQGSGRGLVDRTPICWSSPVRRMSGSTGSRRSPLRPAIRTRAEDRRTARCRIPGRPGAGRRTLPPGVESRFISFGISRIVPDNNRLFPDVETIVSHEWNGRGSRDPCFFIRENLRSATWRTDPGSHEPLVFRCPLRQADRIPQWSRTARDKLCYLAIMPLGRKAGSLPEFIRSRPDRPCPMLERPHETNRENPPLSAEMMRETAREAAVNSLPGPADLGGSRERQTRGAVPPLGGDGRAEDEQDPGDHRPELRMASCGGSDVPERISPASPPNPASRIPDEPAIDRLHDPGDPVPDRVRNEFPDTDQGGRRKGHEAGSEAAIDRLADTTRRTDREDRLRVGDHHVDHEMRNDDPVERILRVARRRDGCRDASPDGQDAPMQGAENFPAVQYQKDRGRTRPDRMPGDHHREG